MPSPSDHHSDAEIERPLDSVAIRRLRRYLGIGLLGLGTEVLVLAGMLTGVVPSHGPLTIAAIAWFLLSLPVFIVLLVAGHGKGRDHRPSVAQMFAAGGRH
jgi:hypothetical protein